MILKTRSIYLHQVQTLNKEIKQQDREDAMLTMKIHHLIQVRYDLRKEW